MSSWTYSVIEVFLIFGGHMYNVSASDELDPEFNVVADLLKSLGEPYQLALNSVSVDDKFLQGVFARY